MKPSSAYVRLAPFWFLTILVSLWLGRLGHIFVVIADVLLGAATLTLVLLLIVRPQVRLRKALPKPAIQLDINGPPK
jgi:hypothetical protein